MNKYNVKATSGYISKYKLVAMLDEARKNETNGIADKTYEKAIEITETMDDADIAPVVRGHWIEELGDVISCRCSRCDHSYNLYEDDINGYPYCAWCGAKMDESEGTGNE